MIPLAEKVEASTESNPGIFGFGALGEHLAVVLQSTINNRVESAFQGCAII